MKPFKVFRSLALLNEFPPSLRSTFEILISFGCNTDRMIAKRRSQAIWSPRRKAGIRPPALATKIGMTNLQVKSSFFEKFPE
ncbi:hypothetical protein NPIL_662411 [Nephila pilipes]|uniref:Uncharacterized protein n=1 Tax=Nephila pilipes TaxID=299642 RepID=A0A8X6QUJ6_NEPPI|nr:hypothetical protein NPIL_662411 [Nephila pilipes]